MSEAETLRVKEVFLEALAIPAGERRRFLDTACGGDTRLRERVLELLAAHERGSDLERLAGTAMQRFREAAGPYSEGDAEPPLALVSDYELLEELGRGAAGTVYRARQTSLGREVALKVLRAGSLAGDDAVRRFRREAEAAAALDHPGIVPVFDIGEVDGHCFFSMKRIAGPSLDRALDRFTGEPRKAARLVATVARAVHHAHCRGVLHRDLKPSNILLDADGEPHVADFGIAQPLGEARITQTGLVAGTPAYMSPEQARGGDDVTVATDIWSLGCVLYELITGTPPFRGQNVAEVLRGVLQDDPPPPAHADRDLTTIIGACLAKEPDRRYPTALALAEDLERWLDHRPIAARPATRLERFWLMCRRSPVATSLGILVAVLVVVLAIGAGVASLLLQRRLQETQEANLRANQRLRSSLIANARAERRSDRAGRRAVGLDLLVQAAGIELGPDIRDEAITTLTLPDLRTTDRWDLDSDNPVIAVDDDAELLAVDMRGGRIGIRSGADGRLRAVISDSGGDIVKADFDRSARRLWLLRRGGTGTLLEVWEVAVDPPVRVLRRDVGGTTALARSRDGNLFALAGAGRVELVDAGSFDVVHELAVDGRINHLGVRPDGTALAVALVREDVERTGEGDKHFVEVLSLPEGTLLRRLPFTDLVRCVAWSHDGGRLIAGCDDQRSYVWDSSSWQSRSVLRGHQGEVVRVALVTRRVAVTHSWDGTSRFWDVDIGAELFRSSGLLLGVDRNGRRALLRTDSFVEVGELVVDDILRVVPANRGKAPREIAESPDGRLLATCGEAGWWLWDARTSECLTRVPSGFLHSIAFDPLGGGVLTSGDDGLLRWPLLAGGVTGGGSGAFSVGEPEVLLEGPLLRCGVSPDGRFVAAGSRSTAYLISRNGLVRELGRHAGLDRVAFSPDGEWVAIGSWVGNGIRIWDTRTGDPAAHLVPEESSAMATFSPDGSKLVVSTFDGVSVLRRGSWEEELRIEREGPRRPGIPAAFSPDGELMAVGITQSRIRLLRVDGWRTLADLEPAASHDLFHLLFIDGGRRLAVATPSQRFLIWELETIWAELAGRGLLEPGAPPLRRTR